MPQAEPAPAPLPPAAPAAAWPRRAAPWAGNAEGRRSSRPVQTDSQNADAWSQTAEALARLGGEDCLDPLDSDFAPLLRPEHASPATGAAGDQEGAVDPVDALGPAQAGPRAPGDPGATGPASAASTAPAPAKIPRIPMPRLPSRRSLPPPPPGGVVRAATGLLAPPPDGAVPEVGDLDDPDDIGGGGAAEGAEESEEGGDADDSDEYVDPPQDGPDEDAEDVGDAGEAGEAGEGFVNCNFLPDEQAAQIVVDMRNHEMAYKEIARKTGLSLYRVKKICAQAVVSTNNPSLTRPKRRLRSDIEPALIDQIVTLRKQSMTVREIEETLRKQGWANVPKRTTIHNLIVEHVGTETAEQRYQTSLHTIQIARQAKADRRLASGLPPAPPRARKPKPGAPPDGAPPPRQPRTTWGRVKRPLPPKPSGGAGDAEGAVEAAATAAAAIAATATATGQAAGPAKAPASRAAKGRKAPAGKASAGKGGAPASAAKGAGAASGAKAAKDAKATKDAKTSKTAKASNDAKDAKEAATASKTTGPNDRKGAPAAPTAPQTAATRKAGQAAHADQTDSAGRIDRAGPAKAAGAAEAPREPTVGSIRRTVADLTSRVADGAVRVPVAPPADPLDDFLSPALFEADTRSPSGSGSDGGASGEASEAGEGVAGVDRAIAAAADAVGEAEDLAAVGNATPVGHASELSDDIADRPEEMLPSPEHHRLYGSPLRPSTPLQGGGFGISPDPDFLRPASPPALSRPFDGVFPTPDGEEFPADDRYYLKAQYPWISPGALERPGVVQTYGGKRYVAGPPPSGALPAFPLCPAAPGQVGRENIQTEPPGLLSAMQSAEATQTAPPDLYKMYEPELLPVAIRPRSWGTWGRWNPAPARTGGQ